MGSFPGYVPESAGRAALAYVTLIPNAADRSTITSVTGARSLSLGVLPDG